MHTSYPMYRKDPWKEPSYRNQGEGRGRGEELKGYLRPKKKAVGIFFPTNAWHRTYNSQSQRAAVEKRALHSFPFKISPPHSGSAQSRHHASPLLGWTGICEAMRVTSGLPTADRPPLDERIRVILRSCTHGLTHTYPVKDPVCGVKKIPDRSPRLEGSCVQTTNDSSTSLLNRSHITLSESDQTKLFQTGDK